MKKKKEKLSPPLTTGVTAKMAAQRSKKIKPLPDCDHVSRDGWLCLRKVGHKGKHRYIKYTYE